MRIIVSLLLLAWTAASAAAAADDAAQPRGEGQLLLATTTSVRDSGLLDALLPSFRERNGIAVQVVAVGSGAALRMGRDGNADALITHAEAGERELVALGAASARTPFMENYFVIAGPPEDPAGIADAGGPAVAFRRIAEAEAPYLSRGDDSGTHRKERELFLLAALGGEAQWPGLATTGSGMGLTLQVAGERRAYVLADLGTFLAYRERTGLVKLSGEAPPLRNVYSVLRVSPEKFAGRVRDAEARALEAFLIAPETQRAIAEFGRERFGMPLFRPLLEVAPAEPAEGDSAETP